MISPGLICRWSGMGISRINIGSLAKNVRPNVCTFSSRSTIFTGSRILAVKNLYPRETSLQPSYRNTQWSSLYPPNSSCNIMTTTLTIEKDRRLTLPNLFSPSSNNMSTTPPSVEKDRILTIPNLISMSRILLAPYIANCIISGDFQLATALFVYAGASDFLDGWIARNFKGQSSSVGSFLDPLSDKVLVCTLFLSLTYVNLIPASLTSLVVSRDLLLVYAGLYIRYMGVVPPFTIKKYLDPTLPTTTVQPTTISKINTALQFLLIAVSLTAPLAGLQNHPYLHYLWAATGTTTFLSAVSYAFMKNTYRFSHREYDHQFGKKLTAFISFIVFNAGFIYMFPSQQQDKKDDVECPITGVGADPYSRKTNDYYLKQIRQNNRSE